MFGDRLKILRKSKGLTQKELSEKINFSQSHISALEKNEKTPGGDILISLKEYFEIDLNWLMVGEEQKKIETQNKGKRNFEILDEIEEWLTEEVKKNPGRETWFEFQMIDSFESFKKWKEEKEESGPRQVELKKQANGTGWK